METIKIKSEYKDLFVVYQVWAYTKKGEIPYGCPSTNRKYIEEHAKRINEKVPYFCDIYDTTIYETFVREINVIVG